MWDFPFPLPHVKLLLGHETVECYKQLKATTAAMPHCHSPNVIPSFPSSQVAGSPVFQLQVLPLTAVDIDTQREVTINGEEGQGGGALMISHEHLRGRLGMR